MTSPRIPSLIAALLLPLSAFAASPIDGTWAGTFTGPGGAETTLTFTFKDVGGAVTGSVSGDHGATPITSGTVSGNSFEFRVDLNGTEIRHKAKVSGDTIAMTFTFGDQAAAAMTLSRVTGPAASGTGPSGSWKWTVAPPGTGQTFDVSATLSYAGGKLAGTYHSGMGDAPISDATYRDGIVAFSVVREREGRQFTVKYSGTLSGDTISGTLVLPGFNGADSATVDWKASRSR